ncbi:MAG: glycosyltransferase [Bacteroidetes bacterium]|nr:glycosyltransferase [Bacteroidota bacterium]
MNNLKFSIVTICFNSEKTIADTIDSVQKQDYDNIEHIIVDGLSTDSTLNIVKSKQNNQMVWISEKDFGLYDALNKGIKMCTGDIIGVLHSDDHLAHPQVISDLSKLFELHADIDAVSASVEIYKQNQNQKPYRVYDASKFREWQFRMGIQPPHPGFYIRKTAHERVGYYNSAYKISGDFDWLLRVIIKEKLNVLYSKYVAVHMLDGGVSSSGFNSKKQMNKENLRILKSHKIYSNLFIIYLKYFLKIFQLRF